MVLDTVLESEGKQIDIQPNTKIRLCFQGKYVSFDAYSNVLCSHTCEKKIINKHFLILDIHFRFKMLKI